jgi:hypothetical protein
MKHGDSLCCYQFLKTNIGLVYQLAEIQVSVSQGAVEVYESIHLQVQILPLKEQELEGSLPGPRHLERYVSYAYEWVFTRWKKVCWQEFQVNEQTVGGVAFLVTAQQKPSMG